MKAVQMVDKLIADEPNMEVEELEKALKQL